MVKEYDIRRRVQSKKEKIIHNLHVSANKTVITVIACNILKWIFS